METNKKRRSSILKPQKLRNPLSELEPTDDNTATRLLTRRVSFASSNFIKEFAADPEKNTIWNVTYEEILNKSDSTRSSENAQNTIANQQSQQLIQTTQASIHNLGGGLTTKAQKSNINEPSKSVPNASQSNLLENQVVTKSKCQNETVMEDCNLEFTQLRTLKTQSKLNKTSLDVSSMDFTGFIDNFKPPLNSTTVKQDQEVKLKDVTLTETSMDITDIQLNNYKIIETNLFNVRNPTEIQDKKSTHKENSLELMDKECLGRREIFNATSENMETTKNMSFNLLIGQNIQRGAKFNKTGMFDESMEFTQKVPQLQNNKTRMDQSMEFTQMVPTNRIQENQNFPRILSSIQQNPGIAASQILNKENLEKPINKTNFFNDSLEFTQNIPLNQYNFQSENVSKGQKHQFQPNLHQKSLEAPTSQLTVQEGTTTKLFNNSMEFTKGVPLNQCNFESENIGMGQNRQFQQTLLQKNLEIAPSHLVKHEGAKTKLFDDSMEFTQIIPLNQCNSGGVQNVNTRLNQPTGSTQSLALPQKKLEDTRKNSLNQCNFESENDGVGKKQQFQQSLFQQNLESAPSRLFRHEGAKTKLFSDSMEFTHIIPLNQCNSEGVQNVNMGLNQPTGGTQSLALPQKKLGDTRKNPLNQCNFESKNDGVGKMQQFQQSLPQQNLEIAPSNLVKHEGAKTKLFNDSMDFTQIIPLNQCNSGGVQNVNMVLNQPTGSTQSLALPQKKLEDTRKNPLNQCNFESKNDGVGKMQQFQQSLCQQNLETGPSHLVKHEGAKTKLFDDSMEFTQIIPLNQCNSGGIQNVNMGLNQPTGSTQSLALSRKNPFNQYNFESENDRVGKKQKFQHSLPEQNSEIAPKPLVQQESVKTKLFNDTMEFTLKQSNFEGLQKSSDGTQNTASLQKTLEITPSQIVQREDNNSMELKEKVPLNRDNSDQQGNVRKRLNEPSDIIQNTSLLQRILEIAPNRIVQQEDVKTKTFNDNTKFTENMLVHEYDFEGQENVGKIPSLPSCEIENPALFQEEFESTPSQLVQREDVKIKLFNSSLDLTENIPLYQKTVAIAPSKFAQQEDKKTKVDHQISLNFDKPEQVLLNPESLQNSKSVKCTQSSRILENQSKLFESIEIPDEVPLNSETFLVKYQKKENMKQVHNWTQTWNESTQIVQEMSVNRGTSIHSMQALQMSGIKDLIQNVSIPKMCCDSAEITQELSLGAREVIQKQEESWEKLCNPQLLQERTASQEYIDAIPSSKTFWSDSYEVMIKYECEGLLDEITPPLHDSLNSIDCSPLQTKKPILSLSKTEIPFRTKVKDLEAYLENTSVEMEEMKETLTELKGELLSEMSLPQHATIIYEKIDFDALQNCSFEDDMDLGSDDSSADDSLLRLNFDSNENDEAALTIREKIQNKNLRCKDYCNIIYVENSKCKLETLFGSIRLEVDFDLETGEVNKIDICDRLSDKSQPSALLAYKVFRETLSLKHIKAAVGEHYDVLTLMDYIYMNMQKIVDFISDLDMFEGHFGLKIDSNFCVKFNIVNLRLKILWWITVDLSDMENISEDNITAVAEVGSLKECNIKRFLNNCPRGIKFLSAFINNILSHIKLVETQSKKK